MKTDYVVQMNDNKTVYFVEKEEFDKIGLAMSLGAKTYQLVSKRNNIKNITENRLINVSNIISLNEIIHEDSEKVPSEKTDNELNLGIEEDRIESNSRMAKKIKEDMHYSVGRKLLFVDVLKVGDIPIYDRDIDVPACVISKKGKIPTTIIEPASFIVPTFRIASHPEVSIKDIKERMYNIIDRVHDRAKASVINEEEKEVIKCLKYASFNTVESSGGKITDEILKQAFKKIYKHRLAVKNIVINPLNKDDIEYSSIKDTSVLGGFYGVYKGCDVYLSQWVDENEVLVLAPPEFIGVIPLKKDITVIPSDKPKERRMGWVVFQEIGICVTNPKGIVTIKIT